MPYKHPEDRRTQERRWRDAHPDRLRAINLASYHRNKHKRWPTKQLVFAFWAGLHKRPLEHLKRHYGISPEEYEDRWIAQAGCCAMCDRPAISQRNRLGVDHDHATDKIRGLICQRCNAWLGGLDKGLLELARDYLWRHQDHQLPLVVLEPALCAWLGTSHDAVRTLYKRGLSPADYQLLFSEQHGICGMCGAPPPAPPNRLPIDHDHLTGNVRG